MVCPVCELEAAIVSNELVFNQDEQKLYRKMTYNCRNRNCQNFQKEVGEEQDELPVTIE